jgi:Tol biopolymer transport system component
MMQQTAVYIVRPDGSGLKRLTELEGCAGSPRWSSDSSRVLFTQVTDVEAMRRQRVQTQIVSIDIGTGARVIHSDGKGYVLAPAFVGNTEIGYGVFDPRTQQAGSILYTSGRQGPAGAENPAWSPDGSLVAYNKRATREQTHWTWTEIRASRDPRYEFVGGSAFSQETVSFTRAGDRFVYRPFGVPQLSLVDWNGVGPVLLDGRTNDRRIGRAAVSPDGRIMAAGIWNSQKPEEVGQIVVVDTDGSDFRLVTHHDTRADYPSFSPDGSRIVYQLGKFEDRANTEHGLRILSVADGKVVTLTGGLDSTPTWSPRGDSIAFTGWQTGDFEIYTIRPDGTGLRQLTHNHGNDAHPVWSPDGKWIAFVSSKMGWKDESLLPGHGPQTYGEIFVMRADGTDVRQLTDNQWEEGTIAWPPQAGTVTSRAESGRDR